MCQIDALIEETSYEDLQKFYLNHTSEKIPLLSDVLSYVNGRVPLLIELKLPTKSTRLCHEVHKLLETYQGAYLIQSFNTIGIFWFRKKCPAYSAWSAILLNGIAKPDFISYKFKDASNISLRMIRILYRTPVAVWTLRTPESFLQAKRQYDMVIFEKNF